MGDFFSYTILGLVQGMTEFLPVSSSGHLIIARQFLGVEANGLAVDAVLQLATVLALLVYFWKDTLNLFYTALYMVTGRPVKKEDSMLFWGLIIGTIPGVLLGLTLEHTMETVFRNSHLVAFALIAGSVILVAAELFSKKIAKNLSIEKVGLKQGLFVGLFQCLALVPGMSRSGMTISGGLFLGLSREAAARFGFLLAIPIIAGSGLKKLIDLIQGGELATLGTPLLWGSAVAFFSGLLAIYVLMKLVKTQPLYAFVVYRVALAVIILAYF